jgi:hypothetical protein
MSLGFFVTTLTALQAAQLPGMPWPGNLADSMLRRWQK